MQRSMQRKSTVIRRPKRRYTIGDLDTRVILRDRAIQAPVASSTDFDELFSTGAGVWAKVSTPDGKTQFDGVETDVNVTHVVGIRWKRDVTTETWIELPGGRRLDVVTMQNLEERNQWLQLMCRERADRFTEAGKS